MGIQDVGATELSSAVAEMASSAGYGLEMNLYVVPLR